MVTWELLLIPCSIVFERLEDGSEDIVLYLWVLETSGISILRLHFRSEQIWTSDESESRFRFARAFRR